MEGKEPVRHKPTDGTIHTLRGDLHLDNILQNLRSERILTDDDVRDIQHSLQPADRVDKMLYKVQQKDMKAFKQLLKLLYHTCDEDKDIESCNLPPEPPRKKPRHHDLAIPESHQQMPEHKKTIAGALPILASNPSTLLTKNSGFPFLGAGERYSTPYQVIASLQRIQEHPSASDAEQRLKENCHRVGLIFHGNTPADGNCFFHAVSDQLSLLGLPPQSAEQLRRSVVEFIKSHPKLEGPDGTIDFSATQPDWEAYVKSMSKDGEWADAVILVAMARMLQWDILVVTSSPQGKDDQAFQWIVGADDFKKTPIMLGHVWELHYRSLAPTSVDASYLQFRSEHRAEVQEILSRHQDQHSQCIPASRRHFPLHQLHPSAVSIMQTQIQQVTASANTGHYQHPPVQVPMSAQRSSVPIEFQQCYLASASLDLQQQFQPADTPLIQTQPQNGHMEIHGNPTFVQNQTIVSGSQYNFQDDKTNGSGNNKSMKLHRNIADTEEVKRWRNILIELYSKRRSKIRFGSNRKSIVDTDSLFVNLKLLSEENVKIGQDKKHIDSHLDLLDIKDNKGHPCRHVLLRGFAGCGKSTVINKIAYQWACSYGQTPPEYLNAFHLVIALDVRRFDVGEKLEHAIQNQLLPGISPEEITKVVYNLNTRCLFLIDGYDEMSPECMKHTIQVFDSPLLGSCWVIVTTRPHKVDYFCQRYNEYVHVEVSGFSKEGVRDYVSKFFQIQTTGEKLVVSLLGKIRKEPVLDSLSTFPILLVMICHMWLDKRTEQEQDLPENITELYNEAIMYLNKHWQENYIEDSNNALSEILKELGRVAIDSLFEGQLSFPSYLLDTNCLEDACKIGLVYKEEMEGNNTIVSFIHKTFHEFCAAVYLASLADTNTGFESEFKSYLQNIADADDIKTMEYLLWFCCGLSGEAATVILPYIIQIMGEQHEKDLNEDVVSELEDDWDFDHELDDDQWKLPLKLFNEAETQLKRRSKAKVTDDLETSISLTCKTVNELCISRHVFKPYPFDISILLRFLKCIVSLTKLTLQGIYSTDELYTDASILCKSLREFKFIGETSAFNVTNVIRLLGHMPLLEKLTLCDVIVTNELHGNKSGIHESLKEFKMENTSPPCNTIDGDTLLHFLIYMPSLEKLTFGHICIGIKLNANISVKLKSVKELFVTGYTDINSAMILTRFMPSLQKLSFDNVTLIGAMVENSLSMCRSLKELNIDAIFVGTLKGLFCSPIPPSKINANVLIKLLCCMPFVEKITLCDIIITGDLEVPISFQYESMKELTLTGVIEIGANSLLLLTKLRECMPSLTRLTYQISHDNKVNISGAVDASLSIICESQKKIVLKCSSMTGNTLHKFLSLMPFLEILILEDVCIIDELNVGMSALSNSIEEFIAVRTNISVNALMGLAACMPSLVVLRLYKVTITGELDPYLFVRYKHLRELIIEHTKINSTMLMKLHGSSPFLEKVTFDEVEITGELRVIYHTGSKALKELNLMYSALNENTFITPMRLLYNISSVETLMLSFEEKEIPFTAFRCGETCTHLNNSKSSVDINGSALVQLLSCASSIEKMKLHNMSITGELDSRILVSYQSLRELTLGSVNTIGSETTVLLEILKLLPSLESLKMMNVDISKSMEVTKPEICKSIKELHFKYSCKCESKHPFPMKLLALMPSLETLTLENIENSDSDPTKMCSSLNMLKKLTLGYSYFCKNALNVLMRLLRCMPSLQELVLYQVDIEGELDINSLMTFKSLKVLQMMRSTVSQEILTSLLSCISSLETLILDKMQIRGELNTELPILCESVKVFEITQNRYKIISGRNLRVLLDCMPSLTALALVEVDIIEELFQNTEVLCKSLNILVISYDRDDKDKYDYEYDSDDDAVESDSLASIILRFLNCLPSLETFHLKLHEYLDILGDLNCDTPVRYKMLQDFLIIGCIYGKTLTGFLGCMPRLKKLTLSSVRIEGELDANPSLTCKSLTEVTMNDGDIDGCALLRLLASMPSLQKLTLDKINIKGNLNEDVSTLCEELKECSNINADMRTRIIDLASIPSV